LSREAQKDNHLEHWHHGEHVECGRLLLGKMLDVRTGNIAAFCMLYDVTAYMYHATSKKWHFDVLQWGGRAI